jgi:hypothetical protein
MMQPVNPLYIAEKERFSILHSNLSYFYNIPRFTENGAIILCQGGEADITIDVVNGKSGAILKCFFSPNPL